MKNHKLLEALADISYLAGESKFFSGDSRADVSEFIWWAAEFEKANKQTNWDEQEYILAIQRFTRRNC